MAEVVAREPRPPRPRWESGRDITEEDLLPGPRRPLPPNSQLHRDVNERGGKPPLTAPAPAPPLAPTYL